MGLIDATARGGITVDVGVCEREAWTEVAAPEVVGRLVSDRAPEGWRVASCRVNRLGRRGDRLVAVYRTVLRDGTPGGMRAGSVAAHLYGPGRGEAAFAALNELHAAGLAVPRPCGYDRATGVLVVEHVTGPTWAEQLVAGHERSVRAARAAAHWLARLHALDLDAPPASPDAEAAAVDAAVAELAAAYPEDAPRLRELGERLAARLPFSHPRGVVSLGGLDPEDVALDDREAVVLEIVAPARREPEHDLGRTMARLLAASGFQLGTVRPGARAGAALLRHYESAGTRLSWRRVSVHAAAGLMLGLHEQLCTLQGERTELLVLWPRLAAAFLDSEGEHDFAERLRRR